MGTCRQMRLRCRDAIAELLAPDKSSMKTGAASTTDGCSALFQIFISLSQFDNKSALLPSYTRAVITDPEENSPSRPGDVFSQQGDCEIKKATVKRVRLN